jgi:hypothetical protein
MIHRAAIAASVAKLKPWADLAVQCCSALLLLLLLLSPDAPSRVEAERTRASAISAGANIQL